MSLLCSKPSNDSISPGEEDFFFLIYSGPHACALTQRPPLTSSSATPFRPPLLALLASLLGLEHAKHTAASRPLHCLFPLLESLFTLHLLWVFAQVHLYSEASGESGTTLSEMEHPFVILFPKPALPLPHPSVLTKL